MVNKKSKKTIKHGRCHAILDSGKKCTNQKLPYQNYCKKHFRLFVGEYINS